MIERQRRDARRQRAVPQPCAPLCTVRFELGDRNSHRNARTATVAIGPVGKDSATAKSHFDQLAVHVSVDQVRGRGDLRARLPMLEIAARIRRGCVKLQRRKRQLLEIGHVSRLVSQVEVVMSSNNRLRVQRIQQRIERTIRVCRPVDRRSSHRCIQMRHKFAARNLACSE